MGKGKSIIEKNVIASAFQIDSVRTYNGIKEIKIGKDGSLTSSHSHSINYKTVPRQPITLNLANIGTLMFVGNFTYG